MSDVVFGWFVSMNEGFKLPFDLGFPSNQVNKTKPLEWRRSKVTIVSNPHIRDLSSNRRN